jgi:hypothetical protein
MKVSKNIILHLNSMQAWLQNNDLQNVIFIKVCISKTMFEKEFQNVIL